MKTLNSKLFIGLSLCLFLFSSCNENEYFASPDEWVEKASVGLIKITAEDLKVKQDDFEMYYLIDVREGNEHDYGYIPGAVNIPGGVLIFKIGNSEYWDAKMLYLPQKSDEIIVFCKKGKRSVLAADALRRLGYTNVKYLDGGWKQWELTFPNEYEKNEITGPHEDEGEVGGC